jgi:hypothetical protein
MLARIQKEQAVLRQKMLRMEEHVGRKVREDLQQSAERERANGARLQSAREQESLEVDAAMEREARGHAKQAMDAELERRRATNKRRSEFEAWRNEVALEAANEAFNASAGRLRKLYAVEKLCGNCLQKTTFEQIERSNTTEDGFQRIREVTGLTDVMDIVHKFLNRDVEHEQLKGSVKEAEVSLEELRQIFHEIKRKSEGIAFDPSGTGRFGDIYKEIESSERRLSDAMEEHEHSRLRLQKTVLQVEHIKRWTARTGTLLSSIEEPVKVEGPGDISAFFRRFHGTIEKFLEQVTEQIQEQKITPKAMAQVMTREYNEQARLVNDAAFLRANCRVPAAADVRPSSRQGGTEDDPENITDDRSECKKKSEEKVSRSQHEVSKQEKMKQAEQQKKRARA